MSACGQGFGRSQDDGRDEQIGVDIIRKATEEPLRQISGNAGFLGAIVIEKVLQQNKLIIPVLIEGACMPAAEGLPQEIMGLVERNALVLHDARFAFDTRKLIDELAKKIAPCQQEGSSGKPLRPQRWEVRRYPLGKVLDIRVVASRWLCVDDDARDHLRSAPFAASQ